jgi:GDPmannose 4,6-dehydratase
MAKVALITGAGGQDGAYLAQLLLQKGYKVCAAERRSSSGEMWRLKKLGILQDVEIMPLELSEESNVGRMVGRLQPDEIYNLAAQSFVGTSFEQPIYTAEIDAVGVARVLEAIRERSTHSKFYQASTSEMFGKVRETPQTELTPFYPRSPYGVAKLYGHWITVNYREAYDLFACSGILFNHESPLRGAEFVTRKTTIALAQLRRGRGQTLKLGNLNAQRDWGFAGDYVVGMWQMLNHSQADDYVLATGRTHTVRDFVSLAAGHNGFTLEWSGDGVGEVGIDRKTGQKIVEVDPKLFRPAEVDALIGDAAKAKQVLGWSPTTSFERLVEMMARADYDEAAS